MTPPKQTVFEQEETRVPEPLPDALSLQGAEGGSYESRGKVEGEGQDPTDFPVGE